MVPRISCRAGSGSHEPRRYGLLDVQLRQHWSAEGYRAPTARHDLYRRKFWPAHPGYPRKRCLLLCAKNLLRLRFRQFDQLSVGASTVLLAGRPEPNAVLEVVERFKPTLFFGLPTLYNALLNHPRMGAADLSSIRLCLSAAEVLSQDLFNDWRRRFGHEILEGLGSTEVLHIYLSNTPDQKKVGTAGKRVSGYEIRLTSPEGEPVARGEEGVMWVRGHSSAPCYWNRPDKTEQTMRDGGWIWTGDRLVEDVDGFFTFVGRVDDLIKVSGQWIYPLEIELCLSEHPAIRECAVLGMELPDRRMTTKAFVILRDGDLANDSLTRELQDYVKSKLLPYKYPRVVEYCSDLPKTGTGKIDRQKLRGTPLKS